MSSNHILPPDTQAILLLCGYFGNKRSVKPLSLTEYNKLAIKLHREGLRPADMLRSKLQRDVEVIFSGVVSPERLRGLLGRGMEMGFAVEEWTRQGIWVLSRGESFYPRLIKSRLRTAAPALLFGVGRQDHLRNGGLGIVGSREADENAIGFTKDLARRCAAEGLAVISGGAKGVDREAMQAALDEGGIVTGVMPEGIARLAVSKVYREPISEGRLTLVSPYHPNARWTSGNAMGRNKLIYVLRAYPKTHLG